MPGPILRAFSYVSTLLILTKFIEKYNSQFSDEKTEVCSVIPHLVTQQ